jgi:V/A-type H+-transporting ATPase subunit K
MSSHAYVRKWALVVLTLSTIAFVGSLVTNFEAYAQESGAKAASDGSSSKLIGAGMAFGLAAAGSGIGLGFVGAAGLAAISDNPKMQSRVFIFVGMVESIAIYGIVMMFIILGQ